MPFRPDNLRSHCRSRLRYTRVRHHSCRRPEHSRTVCCFITGIVSAVYGVVTDWCRSGLTIFGRTAGLSSVTPESVITIVVVRSIHAAVCCFITGIVSAVYGVVTDWCRSGLTIFGRTAGLSSVTPESVITIVVVRSIHAAVCCFITGIVSAVYGVVTDWCRSGLTIFGRTAGLSSVTPESVITIVVVRSIHAAVCCFITGIVSAVYGVVTDWCRSGLTIFGRTAGLLRYTRVRHHNCHRPEHSRSCLLLHHRNRQCSLRSRHRLVPFRPDNLRSHCRSQLRYTRVRHHNCRRPEHSRSCLLLHHRNRQCSLRSRHRLVPFRPDNLRSHCRSQPVTPESVITIVVVRSIHALSVASSQESSVQSTESSQTGAVPA